MSLASGSATMASSQSPVPLETKQIYLGNPMAGNLVINGIRNNATYIFTHPELGAIFEPRLTEIKKALEATAAHSGTEVDTDALR